ncbi:tyrosinase family oxidase copper chaperone [Streptomyces sp. NBC_00448]|uniref:tyrosinase family oxidase copper chaperone n=1 Tax=Streptomyces sp. NBC_00448 TaxID=2903652 RepID=UPI002E21459F
MPSRRRVLRTGLIAAAAVSGTAAGLRPMLAAGQPTSRAAAAQGAGGQDGKGAVPGADGDGSDSLLDEVASPLFDEVYRGRRIQGFPSGDPSGLLLLVDGRPLGAMRRYDGSFVSMANHFQPYPTPLATARGAVDVIGSAELADAAAAHHH